MEHNPEEAGTFVTWVGTELDVGSRSIKFVGGANIANHTLEP